MAGRSRKKYFEKEVQVGSEKVTLYSLDGQIWSTRKEELTEILQRHEEERASYSEQITGGPQAKVPTVRPKITAVTPQKNSKKASQVEVKEEKDQKAAQSKASSKKKAAPKKTTKKVAPKKRTTSKAAPKKKGKTKKSAA